jgi:hypothetical protein
MTAKIKLNAASGGGSVSIQAPSSSSNNRVITLPDIADGNLLTTSNSQVVHATATSQTSQASSVTSFADTGLTASITPSTTSSRILVTGYISFFATTESGQNGNMEWNFAICDGSNNILDGTTASTEGYRNNEQYSVGGKHPINFLHSPSTISAITYKIRMNARNSNNSMTLYCQRNGSGNTISRITLMEVAG